MVAAGKVWTAEEVLSLQWDGRRIELVDGVLLVNGVEVPDGDLAHLDRAMTPSPSWSHQDVVAELAAVLRSWLAARGAGHVMSAPADVPLMAGQVVQPDLFVVPLVNARRPRNLEEAGGLLLAVEVLSPSTARADRVRKRVLYQRAGVPEYWIVDPDARLVERWRPGDERPEILAQTLEWQPRGAHESLHIELAAFFSRALD